MYAFVVENSKIIMLILFIVTVIGLSWFGKDGVWTRTFHR